MLCCSALQCGVVYCSVLHEDVGVIAHDTYGCTGMCMLQCAATCCSVLHEDVDAVVHHTHSYARSVCCSVCQYVALWCTNI